jgi:hypothetical protein
LLTLVFRDSDPETVSKGPLPGFRIDGEQVTDGHGRLLARHAEHCWQVDGRKFLRLDCADAVSVRFERGAAASERYGPFTHFSSTDGICYADHEVELLFHCHEGCRVEAVDEGFLNAHKERSARLRLPQAERARTLLYRGSLAPMAGWVLRGFDNRVPAATIVWQARLLGRSVLRSELVLA